MGAQSTGASKFVKDLVLEVPRFPLTCRDALFSASSPVAGAALLGLRVLDAYFSRRIQKLFPRPQATSMPSLTKLVIPNGNTPCNPRSRFFFITLRPGAPQPHKHWRFQAKENFRWRSIGAPEHGPAARFTVIHQTGATGLVQIVL